MEHKVCLMLRINYLTNYSDEHLMGFRGFVVDILGGEYNDSYELI